jgi:tRNA pseudouridine38-40 synthase
MRVAVKFAYDGACFSGYARQPDLRTVEQEVLDILREYKVLKDAKSSCFRTASRTDRGVSALGNVCAFTTDYPAEGFFQQLPVCKPDIFMYGIQYVEPDFYPRHAKQRIYRYYLPYEGLDVNAMLSAAGLFTGEHDFTNFARVEPLKNPVRTIENIIIWEKQDYLVIDFYAQTFLWNQIRRIVSALKKTGEGSLTSQVIKQALMHPEKKVDFQVAAPEPLILKDVIYGFSFDYIKGYQKLLDSFERRVVASLEHEL